MHTPSTLWLIGIPLIATPIIYLGGHVGGMNTRSRISQSISFIALLSTCVPFYYASRELRLVGHTTYTLGSISLCLNGIGLLLAAIALILGAFVVLFSGPYMSREGGQEKYYAMLVAMIGVIIGLGFTCDLFNLWIWFEAMAITSYLLVAFYHKLPLSLEAGFKYLVQSATGSVLVLLGIGLIFSQIGTLNLNEIKSASSANPTLIVAGSLLVIGFGVKTALVPLHTWLPDAHSQAPSGISAMLSGVVIEAGLIALLRSIAPLSSVTPLWGPLLIGMGIINMVFGNLMALRQDQVKRLLAYSSLTHVGYMLFGLGIAVYSGGVSGSQGGFFHMFNHAIMKGLAFLAAGALLYVLIINNGDHKPLMINDLSGASRRYPLIALTFSLSLFALGAIPPLAGFMSEWQIFTAGFETQNIVITCLILFAAFNSVFSLVYYAPLVNILYRRKPSTVVSSGTRLPLIMTIPLIALTAVLIIVGLWPSLMNWLTLPAGLDLLAAFVG